MNSRALLLWVGGFIGVGLLYSAYKGKLNPITAVSQTLSGKNPSGVPTKATTANGTSNAVAPATAAKPAGTFSGVGSGVAQSGNVWYVTDRYGNPVTPIDGVYQGLPANFIPNTVSA